MALSLDSLVVDLNRGERTLREEVGVGHGLGDRRQPHGAAFVVAGDQVFVSEQLLAMMASLKFAHGVVVIVAEGERLLHVLRKVLVREGIRFQPIRLHLLNAYELMTIDRYSYILRDVGVLGFLGNVVEPEEGRVPELVKLHHEILVDGDVVGVECWFELNDIAIPTLLMHSGYNFGD